MEKIYMYIYNVSECGNVIKQVEVSTTGFNTDEAEDKVWDQLGDEQAVELELAKMWLEELDYQVHLVNEADELVIISVEQHYALHTAYENDTVINVASLNGHVLNHCKPEFGTDNNDNTYLMEVSYTALNGKETSAQSIYRVDMPFVNY